MSRAHVWLSVLLAAAAILAVATTHAEEPSDGWTRAQEAFRAERYDEAASLLEALLAETPDAHDAAVMLGWARYRTGDFAAARASFEAVLAAAESYDDARLGLGYALLQLEGGDPAAAAFLEVLEARPEDGDARIGLTLAARRGDASDKTMRAALEATSALLKRDRDDPALLQSWLDLTVRLGEPGEHRLRTSTVPADATPRPLARAGRDYLELPNGDGDWQPFFIKGFNLGTALPGRFPTGFPTDVEVYRGWLTTMADLGANAVRLYTLLPPSFYEALAAHNAEPGARKLWLIQGIWTELPPGHDFFDEEFVTGFEAEIARVIDAVHGNLALAPRPGHAAGIYATDASGSLLALIVGREWEPFAVVDHDARHPTVDAWSGQWLTVESGTPMEVWIARMCDFAVDHQARLYGVLHPVSFANWPTLDPLEHPTESTRAEENAWREKYGVPYHDRLAEAAWEDDRTTVDATRVRPTAAMTAGFFASYHIYPNYPDFLNLEPRFAEGRDHEGPSRYAAYLAELKSYHGDQPVVVAEFGISTSRGIAHVQPHGWHHGGHDERTQGELVARMLRNIHDARYAGGIVFEFMDEWFKGTWSVAPLESPAERRRMWFNAESPEQSYGILAARPGNGRIVVDGDAPDWKAIPVLLEGGPGPSTAVTDDAVLAGWGDLRAVRATTDEGYLYVLIETGGGPAVPHAAGIGFTVAIDTYDAKRGATTLPRPRAALLSSGVEFAVNLIGPDHSQVVAVDGYEPYSQVERGALASPRGAAGVFRELTLEANRERFARDGRRFPAEYVDRGRLRYGSLDPEADGFDTRTDVALGEGTIELRLPWGLLNVADPSSRRVLHQEELRGAPFDTVETEGLRLHVFSYLLDQPGAPALDRLPAAGRPAPLHTWRPWERPRYRLELKHGADRIAAAMRALPDTMVPQEVADEDR